ncbi:hypothetical protein ACFX2C_007277 [Malus domestica]
MYLVAILEDHLSLRLPILALLMVITLAVCHITMEALLVHLVPLITMEAFLLLVFEEEEEDEKIFILTTDSMVLEFFDHQSLKSLPVPSMALIFLCVKSVTRRAT